MTTLNVPKGKYSLIIMDDPVVPLRPGLWWSYVLDPWFEGEPIAQGWTNWNAKPDPLGDLARYIRGNT